MTNATLSNNTAVAGLDLIGGDRDGYAYGGGLFASGAKVTLTNATLDNNVATANNLDAAYGGGGPSGAACAWWAAPPP